MELLLGLPAPAKLNLFLHVTGRRPDGYHRVQTVFQLIELADWLDFERRDDGVIERRGDLLGPVDDDLAVRAARALQTACGTHHGVSINVSKRIPAGSGMGGGSSDAATTLIALNRLWNLRLTRTAMAELAESLGADVPFFVYGRNAFGDGIGEQLETVPIPAAWYAVAWPGTAVPTSEIFADAGLTRNTEPTKMSDFAAAAPHFPRALFGANDLEPVARRKYPEIDDAVRQLARFGCARMTGSGAAVFVATESESTAREAIAEAPPDWKCWAVRGLSEHPLAEW